jgi:hypothetical protein
LKSVKRLPDQNGLPAWVETTDSGTIPLETIASHPPSKLVVRIADPKLPFGGTWTYEITALPTGSTLRIREDGEIYNPLFRFLSRFLFGYTATVDTYLKSMGSELKCKVRFGKQGSEGKALLETSEIVFRGEFRLKIPFASIKAVEAKDGTLRVSTPEGVTSFELGAQAEKWREKILHPKSRLEKLGVKLDANVSLLGKFETEFLDELREQTDVIGAGKVKAGSELIFFAAKSRAELSRIAALTKQIKGATALWIVYSKGQKNITEADVLSAGRKAGLKDVKVVGFSATHTALKFVLPLVAR